MRPSTEYISAIGSRVDSNWPHAKFASASTFDQRCALHTYSTGSLNFTDAPSDVVEPERLWIFERVDIGGGETSFLLFDSANYRRLIHVPVHYITANVPRALNRDARNVAHYTSDTHRPKRTCIRAIKPELARPACGYFINGFTILGCGKRLVAFSFNVVLNLRY